MMGKSGVDEARWSHSSQMGLSRLTGQNRHREFLLMEISDASSTRLPPCAPFLEEGDGSLEL